MAQSETAIADEELCVVHNAPRFDLMWVGNGETRHTQGWNTRYICSVGDLDIYRDKWPLSIIRLVCDPTIALLRGSRYNHSVVHRKDDGNIIINDTDVQPTPYEMSLLYRAWDEIIKRAERR